MSEAANGSVLEKGVLEKFSNSQEKTCVGVSFLTKLQALGHGPATLVEKRLQRRCQFCCEFREIFKNIFFTEHLWAATSDLS